MLHRFSEENPSNIYIFFSKYFENVTALWSLTFGTFLLHLILVSFSAFISYNSGFALSDLRLLDYLDSAKCFR